MELGFDAVEVRHEVNRWKNEGVSTADLAFTLYKHLPRHQMFNRDNWAKLIGSNGDQLRRIWRVAHVWSSLSVADTFLTAIDVHLNELPTICRPSERSARILARCMMPDASRLEVSELAVDLAEYRDRVLDESMRRWTAVRDVAA